MIKYKEVPEEPNRFDDNVRVYVNKKTHRFCLIAVRGNKNYSTSFEDTSPKGWHLVNDNYDEYLRVA